MKEKLTLLILSSLFLFCSCKKDPITEDLRPMDSAMYWINVYENKQLRHVYQYSQYELKKRINYNEDGSILDSIEYYYNNGFIDYSLDWDFVELDFDTNHYVYARRGELTKFETRNGFRQNEIIYDIGLITKVKQSDKSGHFYANYDFTFSNDNIIHQHMSGLGVISFTDTLLYDLKKNPVRHFMFTELTPAKMSRNNVIESKSSIVMEIPDSNGAVYLDTTYRHVVNTYVYNSNDYPIEKKSIIETTHGIQVDTTKVEYSYEFSVTAL